MQDRELYEQFLGLNSPWSVERVDLDAAKSEVHVYVEHARGTKFCCPKCQRELACYDHAPERERRHLDTCQFKTILHARQPRVQCAEHGVQMVNVPWAEKSSRFTLLFERLAINVLQATQTVTGAMAILPTSCDETWRTVERAVERGKARRLRSPRRAGASMRRHSPKDRAMIDSLTTAVAGTYFQIRIFTIASGMAAEIFSLRLKSCAVLEMIALELHA